MSNSKECDTLFVRHLPSQLSTTDQEDLLRHFGATRIHCMGNVGRMKHSAFATFPSIESAKIALKRLHQLDILGCKLVVEFSKGQHAKFHPSIVDCISQQKEPEIDKDAEQKQERASDEVAQKEQISQKINTVAPKWNVTYSFNPRLQYIYPQPTVSILTNIASCLATVPKFYVQVLHLMNKMNLPAPFGPVNAIPPLPDEKQPALPPEPDIVQTEAMDMSSTEESELESDEEDVGLGKTNAKRPPNEHNNRPKKRRKLQGKLLTLQKTPGDGFSSSVPQFKPEHVFDQPQTGTGSRRIEFNLSRLIPDSGQKSVQSSHQDTTSVAFHNESTPISAANVEPPPLSAPPRVINTTGVLRDPTDQVSLAHQQASLEYSQAHPVVEEGGFGKIEPMPSDPQEGVDDEEGEEEEWGATEFISSRKLRRNKLSSSEMKHLNVFKTYSAGEPTTRLYIKNLSKQVSDKDLHYVFGRYVNWSNDQEKMMFDIRLMKEGRMKGQAFVTLPSEAAAKDALEDTNGFLVHDKPMVVQFARSAKPKDKAEAKKNTR